MKNLDVAAPLGRWMAAGLLLAATLHHPAAQAQGPAFFGCFPRANNPAYGRSQPLQATFTGGPLAASAGAGLKIFSAQRGGQRTGSGVTVSNGSGGTSSLIYLLGARSWQPGETLGVSLTAAVATPTGDALAPPKVFQFSAATGGTGRGNFRAGTDPAVGSAPGALVVADLDNDGDLDLVAADQSTGRLEVRLNNGSGGFGTGNFITVGAGVYGVAVGDVDGDGDLDLLTADASSTATLTMLRNDGSGAFGFPTSTTLYNNPTRLVLGDIDGDGDLDLVANSSQQNLVSVRLNDGTGQFDNPAYPGGIGAGGQPYDLALADVDGDFDLDLVLALAINGGGQGALNTILNGGDATGSNTGLFSGGTTRPLPQVPTALAVADLNGDYALDVALVGGSGSTTAGAVCLNNGSGTFGAGLSANCAPDVRALALTDVDADGDLDMVSAGADIAPVGPGALYTTFNNGLANFNTVSARAENVGAGSIGLAMGDVDNDGDVDALTANYGAGTVSVRLNGPIVPPTLRITLGSPTGPYYAPGSTYTFPVTAVGSSAPQANFYFTNTGTDPLTVQLASTIPGGTSVGNDIGFGNNASGVTLNGGESTTFAPSFAVFNPAVAGPQLGGIRLPTNDPAVPNYDILLAGNTAATLPDLVVNTSQNFPLPGAGAYTGAYNNVTITGTGALFLHADLEVHGALEVQDGGLLQTGPAGCWAVTGPGSFTLADRALLYICSPAGIGLTGAAGTVRVSGARSFSPGARYGYNATAAQATGPGLPAQVRDLYGGLNGSSLALTQAVAVKEQLLVVGNADLNTAGHALTLLSNASGTALLVNNGTGRVVGDATVERYNSSTYRGNGYRHYSAPVSNATIGSLATAGFTPVVNGLYNSVGNTVRPFPTVFGFGQNAVFDNGWASPLALTDPMTVGYGYTVQLPAIEKVRFTGPLNQNNLIFGLSNNSDPAGAWYFLGNPFPSPLDWSTLTQGTGPLDNLSNVGAAVYVFEANGPYTGSYRTAVAGVGGSPVIASGQGFFIRTGGLGLGSYIFGLFNRNRVTSFSAADNTFHRQAADPRPLLTLALRDAAATLPADPASIYFTPAATSGFDLAHDAAKLPNTTGLNLATRLGTEDYAINGLPLLGAAPLVLPLTVQAPAAGRYELAVDQLLNFAPGTALYLRDALPGTLTRLTAGTRYAFALAGTAAPGRFSIEFRPAGALASAAQVLDAQVTVWPNPARTGSGVSVAAPAGAVVAVVNALGQTVQPAALVGAAGTLHLPTAGLAPGLYVLRVRAAAGEVSRRLVLE